MSVPLPHLVIFDCDGVLVDSEAVAARVLAGALSELGFAMTAAGCIARYSGVAMSTVVQRVEAEWGQTLPADFLETVRARDAAAFRTELQPVPGVHAMLAALSLPRCVASSGRLAKIRLTLSLTDLLPFFDPHLYSAEMVAHGKPAPDLFLFAAARMRTAPADCVVIEDSPAGVQAAVAAGMRVLGFAGGSHCTPGHAQRLRTEGAGAVFERMGELPALLAGST